MVQWTIYQIWLLLLLSLLGLSACGTESGQTIPHNQVEDPATATPGRPVELRQAIVGVTVPTIEPAVTVDPPTVAPQPTATQNIPGLIGPDNFPEDVNPLTGEKVLDPSILQRRPLAVKIANTARVRPQAGLNQADLVFEHYSEGGITRFTAIFYSKDARRVGSIRSGRLIDLEIPLMYDAAFAYSGSSYPIRQMILGSVFFDRVVSPDFASGGFWRTFDDKNPSPFHVDSLFTDSLALRQILQERGQEVSPNFQNGMAFNPNPPDGGEPARRVEIIYTGTGILWEYQPGLGRYARWSDGERHVDVNDGELLNFKNIVVIKTAHYNTEIEESEGGTPSIQIQIWGEGPAIIFRDGQRFDGFWKRGEPRDMLTFYDQNDQIIPLAPGNTFFEIVPLDFTGLAVSP